MNTSFKQGDRVEFVEDYTPAKAVKGDKATVSGPEYGGYDCNLVPLDLDSGATSVSYVRRLKLVATPVKIGDKVRITNYANNPTSQHNGKVVTINRLSNAEGSGYIYYGTEEGSPGNLEREEFEIIAEPLVEAKAHEYKEGDRVQVTIPTGDTDSYGGAYFQTGTGTVDMVHSNGKRMLVRGTAVKDGYGPWWVDLKFVSPLVEERTKAIPATNTKPQIGDTIVAFWEANGVETRRKGVIASFDRDGTAVTEEGGYITYDEEEAIEDSVFIVERAPKPEPVKVDPNQKWVDAPIGSIALLPIREFQWLKTAWNEWTFFNTKTGGTFKDRTDADINSTNGTQLVTF